MPKGGGGNVLFQRKVPKIRRVIVKIFESSTFFAEVINYLLYCNSLFILSIWVIHRNVIHDQEGILFK